MKKWVHNDDGWMDEEVRGSEIMTVDGCMKKGKEEVDLLPRHMKKWGTSGSLVFFNTPVHYAQGTT